MPNRAEQTWKKREKKLGIGGGTLSPSTLTTGGRKPVSASSYQSLFPKGKAPERPAVPQERVEADRREAGALESRLRLGEATEEDFTGYLEDVRGAYNYTPEPGSWEEMLRMTQSYLRSLEPRAETFADRRVEGRDLLSRLANTVTGAAKEYTGSMASAASTLYQSNYKNTVNHLLNGGVDPELEGLVDPEEYTRRIQEHSRRAIEKMNGWTEDVTQSGAADIAKAQEGLNPAGKLAVDLGVAVTQMAGDGTVGMVTGGGGMLPLLVRSFGGGAYEARQKGYSEEEQVALGLARAATEYFTERLFGGNPVYDRDAGLVNKLVEKVTGDSRLLAVLTSPFFDKIEEGLEEVVGNVLDPMAEWVITGNWEGYDLDRIVEEGVIGILAAMITKGGARVMNGVKGKVGEALNVQGEAAGQMVQNADMQAEQKVDSPLGETAKKVGYNTTILHPYEGATPV